MINPNRVESARAVIHEIPKGLYQPYKVRLGNGHIVFGYDLPARFKLGDTVCIKANYSITGEGYYVLRERGIRFAPGCAPKS